MDQSKYLINPTMEEYLLDDLTMEDKALNSPEDLIIEPMLKPKKRLGKQRREIKPIISKTSSQVTFTKRRNGLFKKAAELCSLCRSEVAVITFSGAGKVFSFGHPNADAVVHRYIDYTRGGFENITNDGNNNNGSNVDNVGVFSRQYKKVLNDTEVEKKRASSSSSGSTPRGDNEFGFWWDKPIDNLGLSELEQLKVSLEGLRDQVFSRVNSINNNNNGSSNSTNQDVPGSEGNSIVYPSSLLPVNGYSTCF